MQKSTLFCFPADTHAGSTSGLMPPEQWQMADGGFHNPSYTQKVIWKQWEDCWDKVIETKKKNKSRLVIVHLGDAIEGNHHDSTEIITNRLDEQERIHISCMDWALKATKFNSDVEDKIIYVAGTTAHTGESAVAEERIARQFDGIYPYKRGTESLDYQDGKYVWDRILFSHAGVNFNVAHAGANPGNRAWTKESGLQSLIKNVYFSSIESNTKIPNFWIRAHMHEYTPAIYKGKKGTIEGIICPAFQGRTHYLKILPNHIMSDIGMFCVLVQDDGTYSSFCEHLYIENDKVMAL